MNNILKKGCCILFCIALIACNSYDFDQEQFRNEVYLISNSNLIYDRQIAKLKESGDTIFLVAGLSGTLSANRPYKVTLLKADSLLNSYNKSNFDIDTDRYARFLPEEFYTIPSLQEEIPAGKSEIKFPVYLKNLDRLSPDSIYFLNYKIDSLNSDSFNSKKKEVLLRVYMENEFSTTQQNTFYNYTSSFVTIMDKDNPFIRRPTSANQVFPLGHNSVRMLAGDEEFGEYKTALSRINERSIKVIIEDQTVQNPLARHVRIESYKTIDLVQLTPSGIYNNTFLINILSTPDGRNTYYKEFRLHYKYRMNESDPYKEVKAILRMEYSPRADLL